MNVKSIFIIKVGNGEEGYKNILNAFENAQLGPTVALSC